MSESVQELRSWLDCLANGPIDTASHSTLVKLLAAAWKELDGHDQTEMNAAKIRGDRIETPVWDAPRLTFRIERHLKTVHGSSRADVYDWVVDLDALTARSEKAKLRQVHPAQERAYYDDLASEICDLILKRAKDARLQWTKDSQSVVLKIGEIIPSSGPKSTYEGRRSRLRSLIFSLLREHGWTTPRANKFVAPP